MLRGNRWWILLGALGVAAACDLNPQPEVPAAEGVAGQKSIGGTGGLLASGGSAGMTGSGASGGGGALGMDATTDAVPANDNDADGDASAKADADADAEDADLDAALD